MTASSTPRSRAGFGSSPRIYAGEERVSAPAKAPSCRCALALAAVSRSSARLQLRPIRSMPKQNPTRSLCYSPVTEYAGMAIPPGSNSRLRVRRADNSCAADAASRRWDFCADRALGQSAGESQIVGDSRGRSRRHCAATQPRAVWPTRSGAARTRRIELPARRRHLRPRPPDESSARAVDFLRHHFM